MNKELKRHKRNDTVKWVAIFLIAILLLFAVSALWSKGYKTINPYCWGDNHTYGEDGICINCGAEKPADDEKDANANNGGMVVEGSVGNGIMISSMPIARSQYNDYGITPLAESAQQLTALIVPDNAGNQKVDWQVAWKNASSTWATGKSVTDYVTVTATSDGAKTANVACLQPFGEQILITASSRENPDIVTETPCTVDYVKRLVNINLQLSSDNLAFDAVYTVNATPEYGVGTLTGQYAETSYKLTLVENIKTALDGLSVKKGVETAFYKVSSSVFLNANVAGHQFQLNGSDAYSAFGGYDEFSSSTPNPTSLTLNSLKSTVNNAFKNAVSSISGTHLVFEFGYTYTYNGTSYAQATATANLKFDADSLSVSVVSVSLNKTSLVF